MINRIHILGAAGSGTTTLGIKLAEELGFTHFDTDDFLWEETVPPYQQKRTIDNRQKLLKEELEKYDRWILTGSMVGWGEKIVPLFELVVYLWLPQETRIARLRERERRKHGSEIDENGRMYQTHIDFISWASEYDTGDENMRSKRYHEKWLSQISSEVMRIEGEYELDEKIVMIKNNLMKFE